MTRRCRMPVPVLIFCFALAGAWLHKADAKQQCPYANSKRWKVQSLDTKPCAECHRPKPVEITFVEPSKRAPLPAVKHIPPDAGYMGENVEIDLSIENAEIVNDVKLYYKTLSTHKFLSTSMEKLSPKHFRGVIPAPYTKCLSASYYFEVLDSYARITTYYEEADNPWILRLDKRPGSSYTHYLTAGGLTLSPIFLALIFLKLKTFLERRRVMDQVFWVKLLLPHIGLSGFELNEKLTDLRRRVLTHPVRGEKIFPRDAIYKKMKMVRDMDMYNLLRRQEMYFATADGLTAKPEKKSRTFKTPFETGGQYGKNAN